MQTTPDELLPFIWRYDTLSNNISIHTLANHQMYYYISSLNLYAYESLYMCNKNSYEIYFKEIIGHCLRYELYHFFILRK